MPVTVEPTHRSPLTDRGPNLQLAYVRLDGVGWAFDVPDSLTTAAQVSTEIAANYTDLELQGFRDDGAARTEITAPANATRIGLSLDEPVTGRLMKAVVLGIVQVFNDANSAGVPVTKAAAKAAILAEL